MSGLLKPLTNLLFGKPEELPAVVMPAELPTAGTYRSSADKEAADKQKKQAALAGSKGTMLTKGLDLGTAPVQRKTLLGE